MKLRYKATGEEFDSYMFNTHAMAEVLTGDDSASIVELDVWVGGRWKDLLQAFRDRDVIPDNYNRFFHTPSDENERSRGYSL